MKPYSCSSSTLNQFKALKKAQYETHPGEEGQCFLINAIMPMFSFARLAQVYNWPLWELQGHSYIGLNVLIPSDKVWLTQELTVHVLVN